MDQLLENKSKIKLEEKTSNLTLSTMQIINAEKQTNHIKSWNQMFKSYINHNYEILEAITFLICHLSIINYKQGRSTKIKSDILTRYEINMTRSYSKI